MQLTKHVENSHLPILEKITQKLHDWIPFDEVCQGDPGGDHCKEPIL